MNAETPTQLVTIPKESALSVFTTAGAIDPYLARIRAEVDAFVPDLTTAAGRKAIASIAYRVAQSKTYLDGVGKTLNDEQKEIPKKIDATRKHVRDTLDQWRDEVRKPLTDWEAAEEARVKKHTDALTILNELSRNAAGRDSAGLRESLAYVEAVEVGPACEEFEAEYTRAKEAAHTSLTEALAAAVTREAEREELERLRKEAAERAEADRQAAALKKLEEEAAAPPPPEPAPPPTNEQPAAQVSTPAPAPPPAAAPADPEVERRAAINRAAVAAFVAGGLTEESARKAVILIAKKTIPAVTISY